MKRFWLLAILISASLAGFGQGFELISIQESYKGIIGETIKAPLRFRNTTEKPITLIIRKVTGQIGGTQKNYFCVDNNCLDSKVEDYIVKVEPGQTLTNLNISLEAGFVSGPSTLKYIVYNKSNPGQPVEFVLNFDVEEKPEKQSLYSSKFITLHDVYPNPVVDHAQVEYKILNDQIKAKIVVHNLLGNMVGEYQLPSLENLIRIKTDDLNAGIYFYTLYIDDEGVMTRKLIVKK